MKGIAGFFKGEDALSVKTKVSFWLESCSSISCAEGAVLVGTVEEEVAEMEEDGRAVLAANLTIFSFLHIISSARWSVDFLAPLFLAAKRMLRLEGKSLAEAERFAPMDLAWMRGWVSK